MPELHSFPGGDESIDHPPLPKTRGGYIPPIPPTMDAHGNDSTYTRLGTYDTGLHLHGECLLTLKILKETKPLKGLSKKCKPVGNYENKKQQ